jgi:hypothetical protein
MNSLVAFLLLFWGVAKKSHNYGGIHLYSSFLDYYRGILRVPTNRGTMHITKG